MNHTTMDSVRENALFMREIINIFISVFSLVLSGLLASHIFQQMRMQRYRDLDWPTKLSMGLWFIFSGEFFRSATIWQILHYQGRGGTYLSEIVPLIIALTCIVIGSLCAIRVMSPAKCGHGLWVGSLAIVAALVAVNYFL